MTSANSQRRGASNDGKARHLLAVNGRRDALFSEAAIERAASETGAIFQAAGSPERFEHRWGPAGHRFYAELMWPFVMDALKQDE